MLKRVALRATGILALVTLTATGLAVCASVPMEMLATPGPHLTEGGSDSNAPETTERRWHARAGLVVFPKDRQAILDHIERRAAARGGRTLARTRGTVTVVTDAADCDAVLEVARASADSRLGEHYIGWAKEPADLPPAAGSADRVLLVSTYMPFTAHPATEPMLISAGMATGAALAMFGIVCCATWAGQRSEARRRAASEDAQSA